MQINHHQKDKSTFLTIFVSLVVLYLLVYMRLTIRKFAILIYILLTSCEIGRVTHQLSALFSVNSNLTILDFNEIRNVQNFSKLACDSVDTYATYYNLVKAKFEKHSNNQSIPIRIVGPACKLNAINYSGIKVVQIDNTDFSIINTLSDRNNLKEVIMSNQTNLGFDPSLSDSPKDILVIIQPKNGDIIGTKNLIKLIVDSYTDALKEQQLFFPNTEELSKLRQIGIDYPLNLTFK